MTTQAELSDKDKAEATKARNKEMEAREVQLNAGKTGMGLRSFLGMTRGRNPQEIQYENWDESVPESLPKTLADFYSYYAVDKMGDAAEPFIVRRLILGDNEILYKEASDPIAEFVEKTWPDEIQKMFKTVVRNYSNSADVSIEDAVALIKPGIVASQARSAK